MSTGDAGVRKKPEPESRCRYRKQDERGEKEGIAEGVDDPVHNRLTRTQPVRHDTVQRHLEVLRYDEEEDDTP